MGVKGKTNCRKENYTEYFLKAHRGLVLVFKKLCNLLHSSSERSIGEKYDQCVPLPLILQILGEVIAQFLISLKNESRFSFFFNVRLDETSINTLILG